MQTFTYNEVDNFDLQLGAEHDILNLSESAPGAVDIITGYSDPTGLMHGVVDIVSSVDSLIYTGGTSTLAHITAAGLSDNIDLGTFNGSSLVETSRVGGTNYITISGDHQTVDLNGAGTGDEVFTSGFFSSQPIEVTGANVHVGANEQFSAVEGTFDQSNIVSESVNFVGFLNDRSNNSLLADIGNGTGRERLFVIGDGDNNTIYASGGTGNNIIGDEGSGNNTHITTGTGSYQIRTGAGLTGDKVFCGNATDTINVGQVANQQIAIYGDAAHTSTLGFGDVSTDVLSIKYNPNSGVSTITFSDGQVAKVTNFEQVSFADGVTEALQTPAANSALAVSGAHLDVVGNYGVDVAAIEAAHHWG